MAYLILSDGSTKILTREEGIRLWETLQDPTNLSEHDHDKLSRIKKIYLNSKHAPLSYLEDRRDILTEMYGAGVMPMPVKEPWYQK